MMWRGLLVSIAVVAAAPVLGADSGNRLAYVDAFCDPYYVGLDAPKLVTPQWIGEEGVELAIVLSVDDLGDPAVYEKSLRPILQRLKQIDGRAPLSVMTGRVDPNHAQLQVWLKEGLSLEAHTFDHPCPCLQGSNYERAKSTFDRSVELVSSIPNNRPVGFRLPCCDSMNSASPRFYAEIFNKTTPGGRFLAMDSSVFMLFTAGDPDLPPWIATQPGSGPRFAKYIPKEREFINYVENYPYPYVLGRLCWEMPSPVPDDWQGNNLHEPRNPATVRDMKAAIDAAALKQGEFTLTFHPYTHNWILNSQVVELIDHAVARHGKKVKFLNFREVYERLTQNVLGGQTLRAANGQDNGVRVLDLNHDGFMDAVIGNENARQTRLWSPEKRRWIVGDFPVPIVTVDSQGSRLDAGVRFGVLDKSGRASILVRNETTAGVWHFDGGRWVADPRGLAGLEAGGPVFTAKGGRDRGVRLCDLDGDGACELIVGNEGSATPSGGAAAKQNAVFAWSAEKGTWRRLPFGLPDGAAIVDAQGRDAGCRLVDIDGDSCLDVVFSDPERFSLHLYVSLEEGWSRKILGGKRGSPGEIPMIVRADGTDNGVWFRYGRLWVQNEDTGRDVELGGRKVRIPVESRAYGDLLAGRGR